MRTDQDRFIMEQDKALVVALASEHYLEYARPYVFSNLAWVKLYVLLEQRPKAAPSLYCKIRYLGELYSDVHEIERSPTVQDLPKIHRIVLQIIRDDVLREKEKFNLIGALYNPFYMCQYVKFLFIEFEQAPDAPIRRENNKSAKSNLRVAKINE